MTFVMNCNHLFNPGLFKREIIGIIIEEYSKIKTEVLIFFF